MPVDPLVQRPGIHFLNRLVHLQFFLLLSLQRLDLLRRGGRDDFAFLIPFARANLAHVQNNPVVQRVGMRNGFFARQ